MTFKIGETCDGCDAIVKNLKKVSEETKEAKALEIVNKNKHLENFMDDAVGTSTKATDKVAKNLNGVGKYKGTVIKAGKYKGDIIRQRKAKK